MESLNRTMQYGNYKQVKSSQGYCLGLNRTMQYGNRGRWDRFPRDKYEFKSYYVVWKREIPYPDHNQMYMFKSYYVVWKHYVELPLDRVFCSLNRTMQYGNVYRSFALCDLFSV